MTLRSNTGHATKGITSACFSPDDKYVASLAQDGIKLWDLETGKELNTWKSKMFFKELLFTPDGNSLLAFTQTDSFSIININTGRLTSIKSNRKFFNTRDVVISPNGKFLAFLEYESVTLWSMDILAPVKTVKIEKLVGNLSFSSDSKSIYFGTRNGLSGTWNTDNNRVDILTVKRDKALESIRFSSNQQKVLVSNNDYSVDVVDLRNPEFHKQLFKSDFAWSAYEISAQGDLATIGGTLDNKARIFSLDDFKEITLPAMKGVIKVVRFSPSGNYVLTNSVADGTIRIWNTKSGQQVQTLEGAEENFSIAYSSKEFLVFKGKSSIKVWDLRNNKITVHPTDSTILCTTINDVRGIYGIKKIQGSVNNRYALLDLISGKALVNFDLPGGFTLDKDADCLVSPDESLLLVTKANGTFQPIMWIDVKNGIVKKEMKLKSVINSNALSERFQFLKDGKHLAMFGYTKAKEKSILFDYDQKPISSFEIDDFHKLTISSDGRLYYASLSGIFQVNLLTGEKVKLKGKAFDRAQEISSFGFYFRSGIAASNTNNLLCYGFQNLYLTYIQDDRQEVIPSAHLAPIDYVNFIAHDSILVSSSIDGQIKFWDVHSRNEILELRNPKGMEWVVKSPDGLFDASPNEFRELYFVKNQEIIELDQMKARFYEPYLLQKKLGFSKEVMRKSRGLGQLDMYPSIKLENPNDDKSILRITLTDQGGGIGRVLIKINHKEAIEDARKYSIHKTDSTVVIDFSLSNHPFLLPNSLNAVDVIAFNKGEFLQSRPKRYTYILDEQNEKNDKLKFFGLFVGISDYNGQDIDLRYASTDAIAFSQSINWSATKQFGSENVFITSLTSSTIPALQPGKENIKHFFESSAKLARPQDILMIFLAGHGINFGGEEGDFYFLTAEASSAELRDPILRESTAISSQELTDYIKMVPCLKQVLILDACHAGRYAYDLLASARSEKPASEIRALERIKDRTGLYVLSGSAADAVSYEASAYGQGLLTYSLLFGVKGAALRDGKYVDVMNLFQFAADEVPRLAESVGGIQKPEIRVPYGAKSFDIGVMDEAIQSKIILPSPKPLFAKSNYSDENTFNDDLRLSEKADEFFMSLQSRGASVIFVNVNRFPNAYALKGRYSKKGSGYVVQSKLFKGDLLLHSFETQGSNLESIIEKIAEVTTQHLTEHP